MKKILIITDNYPVSAFPTTTGWLVNHVNSLTSSAAIDVLSIVKIIPRYKSVLQWPRMREWFTTLIHSKSMSDTTDQMLYRKIVFTFPDSFNWRLNPRLILLQVRKFALSLCRKESYDAILVHWTHPCGELGVYLGKVLSIPIFIADNNGLELYRRYYNKRGYAINKSILERSTCIITQCTSQTNYIRREFPQNKIRQIPLGITMDKIQERRNTEEQIVRVISVARLDDALKNIDKVIESLRFLPTHYQLTIVGSGYYEKSLKKMSTTLGLSERVRFAGWVDNNSIDEILRKHDIFVLPSEYESFGLVYLEAIKAGLALVSTDVGVIGDLQSGVYPFFWTKS